MANNLGSVDDLLSPDTLRVVSADIIQFRKASKSTKLNGVDCSRSHKADVLIDRRRFTGIGCGQFAQWSVRTVVVGTVGSVDT